MKRYISKFISILLVFGLIACLFAACGSDEKKAEDKSADLIVYGDIYTADDANDHVEAIAVKNGKYIYAGDKAGAEEYKGSGTEIVEADFVMPSGVESHTHYILEEAFKLGLYIDCYKKDGSGKPLKDIVTEVVTYREENPKLEGIFGYGWNKFVTEDLGETVTRELLDEAGEDIPIFISGRDLHSAWCNTKCLEMAGALEKEIPTEGVVRDKDGLATGRLNDEACTYIRNKVFGAIENYGQAVLNAQEILLSKGYTMNMDAWSNYDGTTSMYEAIEKADEDGKLTMNMIASYTVDTFDDIDEEVETASQISEEYQSKHLDMKFVKLFCDGTEDAKTAYQLEPYSDGTYGTDNWDPEKMAELTTKANEAGLLVHVHAYGDASARQTLDAFEISNERNAKSYRNSIGHAPYVAKSDLKRIADMGIGVAGSANWGVGDDDEEKESAIASLGEKRYSEYSAAVDRFVEYGIKAGMSTDRPCADDYAEDIFDYIGVLTTGVDYREGYQQEAKYDKWVSVEDAIKMMTIYGAWSLDADKERGSIEVGKYADFITADGNPFETDLPKIQAIDVCSTYFEGAKVFDLNK